MLVKGIEPAFRRVAIYQPLTVPSPAPAQPVRSAREEMDTVHSGISFYHLFKFLWLLSLSYKYVSTRSYLWIMAQSNPSSKPQQW